MPLLIAALLALSAGLIVLYPLLGLVREPATPALAPANSPAGDAAERERLARQALREVEFDYTLGNLETGDYEALRERYETRALSALKARYQREQELDALIERQLDALRQSEGQSEGQSAVASEARPEASTSAAPVVAKPAASRATRPSVASARSGGASVRARRAPNTSNTSKRKGS